MNLAFLPLFTPFMSAGPGSLVGLFECVHFGRRWKESGEHGILNHLMRRDRQRFCPACSGAASSQRPLTDSDTSLCCRPECVCVCMCMLVCRQHYFSLPGICVRTICLSYISAFIRISSPEWHAYLLSAYLVSSGSGKHICVWWGLSGRQKEAASCVRLRCWGQGRSLRVFGLGLQLACADWAGAWRENPAEETNKQVAASKGLTSLVLVITSTLTFITRTCWSNELNA